MDLLCWWAGTVLECLFPFRSLLWALITFLLCWPFCWGHIVVISLVLVYGYFCPIVRSPIVKSFLWESDLSIEKVTSLEGEATSLQTSDLVLRSQRNPSDCTSLTFELFDGVIWLSLERSKKEQSDYGAVIFPTLNLNFSFLCSISCEIFHFFSYFSQTEQSLLDQDRLPETAEDFDRAVLSSPNNSVVWLQYMAYHLHTTDIDKARTVAERALKTISFR